MGPSRPAEARAPAVNVQTAYEPFPERRVGVFEPAPDDMVALRFPMGQAEEPIRTIGLPPSEGMAGPAFREGNWLVALIAQDTKMYEPEPGYTPLQDIAETRYLTDYSDEFVGSRSSAETKSIIAHIDRREKDQRTLQSGGWLGTVAGIGAGLFDPLNLRRGKTVFKLDFPGTVAIFWMANPDAHIFYALDDLDYLARIDGRVDDGWYSELGSWPPTEEQDLSRLGDHIERRPLACFGNPPLALLFNGD